MSDVKASLEPNTPKKVALKRLASKKRRASCNRPCQVYDQQQAAEQELPILTCCSGTSLKLP